MWRSVAESSTTRIRLMVMEPPFRSASEARASATMARAVMGLVICGPSGSGGDRPDVRSHRLQQALFGEWLRQVLIGTHHPPASAIEQPVLRRQHHDGNGVEAAVFLDQRARL